MVHGSNKAAAAAAFCCAPPSSSGGRNLGFDSHMYVDPKYCLLQSNTDSFRQKMTKSKQNLIGTARTANRNAAEVKKSTFQKSSNDFKFLIKKKDNKPEAKVKEYQDSC